MPGIRGFEVDGLCFVSAHCPRIRGGDSTCREHSVSCTGQASAHRERQRPPPLLRIQGTETWGMEPQDRAHAFRCQSSFPGLMCRDVTLLLISVSGACGRTGPRLLAGQSHVIGAETFAAVLSTLSFLPGALLSVHWGRGEALSPGRVGETAGVVPQRAVQWPCT